MTEENYRVSSNFRWLGSNLKGAQELSLTVCGIEKCKPDKSYGPTVRKDYHVHMVLSGAGHLVIDQKSYEVKANQIFVTFPDVEIYYYTNPKNPWHYTWISFGGTRAQAALEKAGLTLQTPVRDAFMNPLDFLSVSERILNHHELNMESEFLRTSCLYEAVSLLISSYQKHSADRPTLDYSSDVYINAALDYIHCHYSHIQVKDIADYIGISRYYLTRLFSEKLHISPVNYLSNYRLEQAKELLLHSDISISELAFKMGYTSPFSFSQSFKKRFGLSPKHCRRLEKD